MDNTTPTPIVPIVPIAPKIVDCNGNHVSVGDKVFYAARGYRGRVYLHGPCDVIAIVHDQSGFAIKLNVQTQRHGWRSTRRQTLRNFSRLAKV